MIRRLAEADRLMLAELLSSAPQFNLYLSGNLESPGFGADYCEFFGDVADGRVRGVINRYMSGWTVFGEADADWVGLGAVVDTHKTISERLQDNPGGVMSFLPYLQCYAAETVTEDHLMELPDKGFRPTPAPMGFEVRKATMADLSGLVKLFADAGDMSRTPSSVEIPLRDRRVWIGMYDHEIVSAALTNAETHRLAMIGGVYTSPEWRGKGLSQAVCSGLCRELIDVGRQPVLYWHDPVAGHVYTKLGFRAIGLWHSVKLVQR